MSTLGFRCGVRFRHAGQHERALIQIPRQLGFRFRNRINTTTKLCAHVTKAVSKPCQGVVMLNGRFVRLTPELFILACSAIVRSNLKYCAQARSPSVLRDVNKLETPKNSYDYYPLKPFGSPKLLERRCVHRDLMQPYKLFN